MKKPAISALISLLALVLATPAQAIDGALADPVQIQVVHLTNTNVYNTSVLALPKNASLVSWLDSYTTNNLRARTVSSSNELGRIITLNTTPASVGMSMQNAPKVVGNSSGKLLAIWISSKIVNDVEYQKVLGRTSSNGSNWSKAFLIAKPIPVTGGQRCEDDMGMGGCGYSRIYAAVDGSGRYSVAVGVASTTENNKTDLKVTTASKTNAWSPLKKIGSLRDIRQVELVGLRSGFMFGYTNYVSGTSCSFIVSYFNPVKKLWGAALKAQSIADNTVIQGKIVQRDAKTVSIVTIPELLGGIQVRNFSLVTRKFTSFSATAKPAVTDVVYQNVSAAARGSKLVIGYASYDRNTAETAANLIVQTGVTGGFTSNVLETANNQIDPLAVGINGAGHPYFSYMQYEVGSHLTVLNGSNTPMTLNSPGNAGYSAGMLVSKSDLVSLLALQGDAGTYDIYLTKGQMK